MTYRRKRNIILAVISFAVIAAGVCLIVLWPSGSQYTPRSLPVRAPSTTPAASAPASSGASPQIYTRSQPTEIIIPAIGVDAQVIPVYDPGGVLQTPPLSEQNVTGWWAGVPGDPQQSYAPGQRGPAVIVGHINSYAAGDLVFANLDKLVLGDAIRVKLADGNMVTFEVSYPQETLKTQFPTQAVYGPTSEPTLRLITCGGQFDSTPGTSEYGHYLDNYIVYATEVST
jgi:hypothetical protein